MKLKKINFSAIKSYFFQKIQILTKYQYLKKNSFDENCKYFIGYLYNDHKVRPLHIMLPERGAYVKSYEGQDK